MKKKHTFFVTVVKNQMNRGEVEEIVQTTVRKLNCGPEACLTNPRVLSFFNMMKDSVTRCITAVSAASTTAEDKAASYRTVLDWSSSRQQEEVNNVLKRYPSVKDAYTYSAVYIVEQTYKKENRQLKLKLPSFQQFLVTFYTQVLTSEPLVRGTYDGLQFFEKEMLCCQAFCNALYNSIRTEPVERQQSVIVEQGKSGISKSVSPGPSAAAAVAAAASSKKSPSPLESQIASASRFSMRALSPNDSVSQMVKPAVAAAAASSGSLTEEALNKHRSKMGSKVHPAVASAAKVSAVASAVASAAAASVEKVSVTKSSPVSTVSHKKKESVKVIDVVEHPQKHFFQDGESNSNSSTTTTSSSSSEEKRSPKKKSSAKKFDMRRLDRDFEREFEEESSFYSTRRDDYEGRGSHRSERSERSRDRDRDRSDRDRDRSNPNRRH